MKKTSDMNLNGMVFHIEDDAYAVLEKYLADIAALFAADDDRDEIMADIEARIAELFGERLQRNRMVVTSADVQEVIAVMGRPDQFAGDEGEGADTASGNTSTDRERRRRRPHRFYRDPDTAVLGGVCGGMAARFGWDAAVVRLVLALVTVLTMPLGGGWFFVLAYFLLWIVAPAAVTPSQRLEMQGEEVTVENIKAEFDNLKNYAGSEEFKSSARTVGQRLGQVLRTVLKIVFSVVGALVVAGFVFVLFVTLVSLFAVGGALSIAGLAELWAGGMWMNSVYDGQAVLLAASAVLVLGCPVFALLYALVRAVSGHRSRSKTVYRVLLVLWGAGVLLLAGTAVKRMADRRERGEDIGALSLHVSDTVTDRVRDVEEFSSIRVSGGFEVEITDSPNRLLVVSAAEADMDDIKTRVKDGTLFVSMNPARFDRFPRGSWPKISLSARDLEEIQVLGAAKVYSTDTLSGERLHLSLQGAGKVDLTVAMEHEVQVYAEGAASVRLAGDCDRLTLDARGAAKVKAGELKARHVDVDAAGACSAEVYASESLTADAAGAAKIDCTGSPKQVKKTDRKAAKIRVR